VACLNFKKQSVKEPDYCAYVCTPIFWEGKGNGKHEMEKFLKRKFNEFINALSPNKKSHCCGNGIGVVFKAGNAFLFFVLIE
jgi:hypothetical protein